MSHASILLADSLRDGARLRRELAATCAADIVAAAGLLAACLRAGGKVLLFGNGGSAADAQHMAAELVGRFAGERAPLPALALTVDPSAVTAIANDYGFEQVFARQVRAHGRPGDLAVAISTSGRSPNVHRAIEAARAQGMKVIGLAGGQPAPAAFVEACDAAVVVPSTNTARIQELHITVLHILCELLEADLRGELRSPPPQGDAPTGKALPLDDLCALRERFRAAGRVVVWTNGCFDLLHPGHLLSLSAARDLGDVLVVGVNGDASVRALKGEGRPILPAAQRMAMLAALEVVDYVVVFDEVTPEVVLGRLRPDIHCKGADYAPPHGAPIPEKALVESYGGRVEFLPLVPGLSTTALLERR